jgi:hypothetical protein
MFLCLYIFNPAFFSSPCVSTFWHRMHQIFCLLAVNELNFCQKLHIQYRMTILSSYKLLFITQDIDTKEVSFDSTACFFIRVVIFRFGS